MKNRVISIILSVLMLFSSLNIIVLADNSGNTKDAVLVVDKVWAQPGEEIQVSIKIENNPGILGAALTLNWEDSLELVSSSNGEAFSELTLQKPANMVSGCRFVWYGSEVKKVMDSDILNLTFLVREDAKDEEFYSIGVSYDQGDIRDVNYNLVDFTIEAGGIRVITYIPGDATDDGRIDPFDLIRLSQYISDGGKTDPNGFNVVINTMASDVNDDQRIDPFDLILIARYISDGCVTNPDSFNVVLKPSTPKCDHSSLTAIPAKAATCTEDGNSAYWVCECGKYFGDSAATNEIEIEDTVVEAGHNPGDEPTCTEAQICTACGEELKAANGHTEVTVPGYAPTYENVGKTDGVECSVCRETLVEQQDIPVLTPDTVSVTYEIAGTDTYLQGVVAKMMADNVQIHNNPNTINTTNGGYTFLNIASTTIPGYTFLGWYDGYSDNATQVKNVAKGQTGSMELYAKWSKNVYTVTFDSPDVDVEYTWYDESKGANVVLTNSAKYTVDTGLPFKIPEWFGYTFVGWSNNDGFIIDEVEPGTTGNITVHANWTCNRNKAVSYSDYGDPIIVEDDKNGRFIFVYNIGRIENVPLNVVESLGNTQQLDYTKTYSVSTSVDENTATKIANTISNATTRSSSMTLAEEWEQLYAAEETDEAKNIKTKERVDSEGNVVGGNYYVSNSEGGSSYMSTESGGSNYHSAKVTTEDSAGINSSYDKETETHCDAKLGISNTTKVSAGVEFPVEILKVKAGVENSTTVSAEVSSGRKDKEAYHVDSSLSSYVGTDTENTSSAYYNATASASNTWNSSSSYESSHQTSIDTSVSEAISDEILKSKKYSVSNALGGSQLNTETVGGTDTRSDEYSTTIAIGQTTTESKESTITLKSDRPGYYRVVSAGTFHVYGAVGYDVATSSYFTYTFNVMDDEVKAYLDYSKESSLFDDCENALVPFEIPFEVNEYVLGLTGRTEGLIYGLDDNIVGFEASDELFSGSVVVPQYYSVDNLDGTFSAHKTTSFSADAFRGNTEIETVILPAYVTEIPDDAFAGCTNLKTVIAYGVTSIGDRAFSGCVNLKKFSMDNLITHIGEDAFEGVPEIAVMAYDSAAADAAIASGASKITVDLTKIVDSYNNKKIVITDSTKYFALIGGGKTLSNVSIESDASEETFISNITFADNKDTPLKLGSETVTLARVTVKDAPAFAMILEAENCALKLLGSVNLGTAGTNAVLSKNVTLSRANSSTAGKLDVTGTYLVCGEITNTGMLSASSVETIDEEAYNSYLSSITVTFNPNGGSVLEESRTVYYGQTYGELPTPTRDNYIFDGWFTEPEGGDEITSESAVDALANLTLYAHWTPKTFTVTYDANGGSVSVSSVELSFGDTYGALPTPTRDYYTFDGWYTEASGGTAIAANTAIDTAEDITIYAHWTQNPLLGYVLASAMPAGAQVVNRYYTYDLTEYTTSSSPTLSGWTQYYSEPDGYTDYGSWSEWSDTQYYEGEFRKVESRQVVSGYAQKTQYRYSRYLNYDGSVGDTYSQGARCNGTYGGYLTYGPYYTSWLDSPMTTYGSSSSSSSGYSYGYNRNENNATDGRYLLWFNQETRLTDDYNYPYYKTQWRYADRSRTYIYHFSRVHTNLRSDTYPSGLLNSNIQEWVQYRVK